MDAWNFNSSSAETRLRELVSDCNEWYSQIANAQSKRLSITISNINRRLSSNTDMNYSICVLDSPVGKYTYSWLESMTKIPDAEYGMNVARESVKVDNGAAALKKLINCPEWFKFISINDQLSITFDLNSIGNSSDYGSMQKALRKAIEACIETRKNLYKAYLINCILIKTFKNFNTMLFVEKELPIINKYIGDFIENIQSEINSIPDQEIYQRLADMDIKRESWTKADGPNSYVMHFKKEGQENILRKYVGCIVKTESSDAIYMVEWGVRHKIPNSTVYFNFFNGWQIVQAIDEISLQSIPLGAPLSQDAGLIKSNNSDIVYFYSNNIKRKFHSSYDFKYMVFDEKKIKVLSPSDIDKIPTGPDFIGICL